MLATAAAWLPPQQPSSAMSTPPLVRMLLYPMLSELKSTTPAVTGCSGSVTVNWSVILHDQHPWRLTGEMAARSAGPDESPRGPVVTKPPPPWTYVRRGEAKLSQSLSPLFMELPRTTTVNPASSPAVSMSVPATLVTASPSRRRASTTSSASA